MRLVVGLLVGTLAGCGGGPNLDKAVASDSPTSIRELIVGHRHWGEKLSAEQLDDLAAFIAEHAGQAGVADQAEPGLVIWKASDCGSCHVLAASGDAER